MASPEDIVKISQSYLAEAEEGRKDRIRQNRANREASKNQQDFSGKIEGQSREFLPKTSTTSEQFAAFLQKGLVQFGPWFSTDMGKNSPLSNGAVRETLRWYLDNLPMHEADNTQDYESFATRLKDGVKVGLLESLMVFKVGGRRTKQQTFADEDGELTEKILNPWRLDISLIPPEDYYPDPTRRRLYEMHRVERDLHDLEALAEKKGVYDKSVLDQIKEDFRKEDRIAGKRRKEEDRGKPTFRKRVQIDEYWGTLLDCEGNVVMENAVWAIANEKYLIRKPEKNPYWHKASPFVVIPLMREPFTVWHKALYDDVVPLNLAINELFNLMLDGGLASVWGIRQVYPELLEDPNQVAGGIPQGKTLVMRSDAPNDAEALKQVTTGKVPQDALAMFSVLDAEFNAAARTNDLKMGSIPSKEVKATEIVEMQQSQGVVIESIVTEIERGLTKLLRKAWLVILQEADNLSSLDLQNAMSRREMRTLAVMDAKDRFLTMGAGSQFKADGLSATLGKTRDFQRLMAALQVGMQNPVLQGAMLQKTDPMKIWQKILVMLNINPEDIERDEEGIKRLPQDVQMMGMMTQQGQNARIQGQPGLQSEVNQEVNPSEV